MNPAERQELIARYLSGYEEVLDALEGITDADLDRGAADREWSPRQVIHHLADSEMTGAVRLRRLLAEDSPSIKAYDEEAFARSLHYDRPVVGSLQAFKAARESTASLLGCLTDEEWQKSGTHSDFGHYSVDTWLQVYADHAHDHADQIRRIRGLKLEG